LQIHPIYPPGYAARSAEELELALNFLPAYAAWRAADPGPAADVDARYAALPLLDKAALRQWGMEGFVAPGHDLAAALSRRDVETAHTSGTTDEQVELTWNQRWWDASERASWTLNRHAAAAALGSHREAILTSPLSVGVATPDGRPVPLPARRLERFLYLNEHADARDWDDDHIRRMADELGAFQPRVIEANPTLLARFARRLEQLGLRCWQPRLIVFSFELPSQTHRRQCARLFACPTMSSHGCTEAGCVFTECEAGRFHQNAEFVRVEFQPLAARAGQPGIGRIALTSFGNPWRVLLRYDVGDLVRLRPRHEPCPCGRREGLTVEAIEGRVKDLTFACDGRPVTVAAVDRALEGVAGLYEYQVVQTASAAWRVAAVTENDGAAAAVRGALRELYRGGAVAVRRVPAIAPEPSGKHRLAFHALPFVAGHWFEGGMTAP